jgi:hypothetical protein
MNLAHFGVGILLLPYGVLYALTVAPVKFFIHVYEFILEMLEWYYIFKNYYYIF